MSKEHIFAITKVLRTTWVPLYDGWYCGLSVVYDFLMGLTGGSLGGGGCASRTYGMNAYGADMGYFTQMMSYQRSMQDLLSPLPDYWYNDDTGQFAVYGTVKDGDIVVIEAMIKSFVDVPSMVGNVSGYATAGSDGEDKPTIADIYNNPTKPSQAV
ncbi:head completion [Klebsiella phage CPRSA]|nr:head completion [Klebsiella phage CPRSA]